MKDELRWEKIKVVDDEIVIEVVKKFPSVCFWMIRNSKKNIKKQ